MAQNTESEFLAWFEQQFGKRPSKLSVEDLRQRVGDAKYNYDLCCVELNAAQRWECNHTAALYAWTAARTP